MERNLTMLSSPEQKKVISDVVFDRLTDYFFDKVTFISLAYSDLGVPTSSVNIGGTFYKLTGSSSTPGTTETASYNTSSRLIDSSSGLYMKPGLSSRMRCSFYLKNPEYADAYLLSPCVYDGLVLPSPLTSVSDLTAYIGLRFIGRDIYVTVKESGGTEKNYNTGIKMTMYNTTFSDTYILEIRHNIRFTDILINNVFIGSYASDLVGSAPLPGTFYAFFAPGRTTNASFIVNIVAEHIQFIQSKN